MIKGEVMEATGVVNQTASVARLQLGAIRPGEGGCCQKKLGSGNCMYSITRLGCSGIIKTETVGGREFATKVQCDSPHCGGDTETKCFVLKQAVMIQRRMNIS